MNLSNKAYDVTKFICLVVSPALCTLLEALNVIWKLEGFPVSEIVLTIGALTAFVGACLKFSSDKYAETKKDE